ncbi:hypothetical protein [Rossellomorea aquimaris]|uniref:Uncharacterized protein n=1 Tax=Rossellomorea aquimaris TaxID=189382 RepID=A0A5D4UJV5_9BACI|nr:hypothetical protein [Rossellomorea aquimaris]TYS75711.1 hypothetical protein FZD05_20420 [Rossellomorea aquimaris]TYS87279.1 hypothetical protein FZC85_09960 [Rossellomorea aquimaris]
MKNEFFSYNSRLGIHLPRFSKDWPSYSPEEQEIILLEWERVRGMIPDRIQEIEEEIERLQAKLAQEDNFDRSCMINGEISERASEINDLWIWYRTTPDKTQRGMM